jgi:hypothetical protein
MAVGDHTHDDPKFSCKTYSEQETYNSCQLRQVLTLWFLSPSLPVILPVLQASQELWESIGCVPHWFQASGLPSCGKLFYPSAGNTEGMVDLLEQLWQGGETQVCPKPCRAVSYESRMTHFNPNSQWGIGLVFEDHVTLTKSVHQIDTWTLIARIGGVVGFGRTSYWIISTFVLTALTSVMRLVAKMCRRILTGDKEESAVSDQV